MLACVTTDDLTTKAKSAGLTTRDTGKSATLGVALLYYRHKSATLTSEQSVTILHQDNGEVAQIICDGVIGAKLDADMSVCTDAGPPSRADQPQVRAWALKASATLRKNPKAVIELTTSNMLFAACGDIRFPPPGVGVLKAQMQLFVQEPKGVFNPSLCFHGI
ncbi:MAG: hypothetical protein ACR2KJ_03825 [Jatrophihabitans sp.]